MQKQMKKKIVSKQRVDVAIICGNLFMFNKWFVQLEGQSYASIIKGQVLYGRGLLLAFCWVFEKCHIDPSDNTRDHIIAKKTTYLRILWCPCPLLFTLYDEYATKNKTVMASPISLFDEWNFA